MTAATNNQGSLDMLHYKLWLDIITLVGLYVLLTYTCSI